MPVNKMNMMALTLKEMTFILKQHSAKDHHKTLLPVQKFTPSRFFCYGQLIILTIDKTFFFLEFEDTDQLGDHYSD